MKFLKPLSKLKKIYFRSFIIFSTALFCCSTLNFASASNLQRYAPPKLTIGTSRLTIDLTNNVSDKIYYLLSPEDLGVLNAQAIIDKVSSLYVFDEELITGTWDFTDQKTNQSIIKEITGLHEAKTYWLYLAYQTSSGENLDDLTLNQSFAMEVRHLPLYTGETDSPYGYYRYLPEEYYFSEQESFPVIIFFHGVLELGNGDQKNLSKILVRGIPEFINKNTDYPAIVLSPQTPEWWNIEQIDAFLEHVKQTYRIDEKRIYMTGLSMGGDAVWRYAANYNKIAAIVPIAAPTEVVKPERLTNTPVWAFHNKIDQVVGVRYTENWIKAIIAKGGSPKVTYYFILAPWFGHDITTTVYKEKSLFEWLFEQHL